MGRGFGRAVWDVANTNTPVAASTSSKERSYIEDRDTYSVQSTCPETCTQKGPWRLVSNTLHLSEGVNTCGSTSR
jgi:hypothetical protein